MNVYYCFKILGKDIAETEVRSLSSVDKQIQMLRIQYKS